MQKLKTKLLEGPHAESIDKLGNFVRYLIKRFIDDRCFETAGSLSYTSILAIVPFAAVVFTVFTAFPVFDQWSSKLTDFVFANFVPDVANNLENALLGFANSARTLPTSGVLALLISVALTMWSVENAFNRIWRVPAPKPKLLRFLIYWGLLTLGSLLVVSLLALNSILSVYFNFADYTPPVLYGVGLALMPILIELIGFTSAYWLIPHRDVPFRFALAGGVCATLLFEALKWLFTIYLESVSYQHIYGAVAVVPISLVWLYLVWTVILLCASVTATLSSFQYRPKSIRSAKGIDFYWVLRLVARFNEADREKRHMAFNEIARLEANIAEPMLRSYLLGLANINLLESDTHDHWWLSKHLEGFSLRDLHQGLGLRIPLESTELPSQDDHIDAQVLPIIHVLRGSLKTPLERTLSSCFG
ncbi:MAG TPA: YihY family inner membrane protein [Arenimonas sp.]|nr:YihY family inner membrane protein [Arenimonas sp.]